MTERIEVNDVVQITDGSYAERLDKHENYTHIGLSRDLFEVIQTRSYNLSNFNGDHVVHDIHIRNMKTGRHTYLHSSSMVQLVERPEKSTCPRCYHTFTK